MRWGYYPMQDTSQMQRKQFYFQRLRISDEGNVHVKRYFHG